MARQFTGQVTSRMTHPDVLLELLHCPRGAVASTQVLEQAAGEHGIELQEEMVDGQVQVEVEFLRSQPCGVRGEGSGVRGEG